MGNLIHRYITNTSNNTSQEIQAPKSERSYFQIPTMGVSMDSFDKETDKLIKPLDGRGHLVNDSITSMPREFVRDTVYTTKAFADGVRGKANDHQLGKLNDLGLKIGGLAIATYLMTKKSTPKTKAMEFVGFGAFLASMALWPKIALEIPARIIHGFNFRKQYIDDQGRKKFVSQDPNYIPFDLYKGDKKSEDLDVIGDRLGISRDIPNRHEAVKEQMRKISVQNNTLWMLTAGLATPIMTALACNKAEKLITPIAEKFSNKKTNASIDKVEAYLAGTMTPDETLKYETETLKIRPADGKKLPKDAVSDMLAKFKGKKVAQNDVVKLADTLAHGLGAEMQDAARVDIIDLIGGERYVANANSAERLASTIHSAISASDATLASKITPEKIKTAASEGIVKGAVKDMLTSIGFDVLDKAPEIDGGRVSTNFKCKELDGIDFFRITEETKNMTPRERLAHNIKSIVLKVNNSAPDQDFIPGMSNLECKDKALKAKIDEAIITRADDIAKQFYEGELAIGNGRESYVRESISKLYKAEAPRGPKSNKLFAVVNDVLKAETSGNRAYVFTDDAIETIGKASKEMTRFRAIDDVLSAGAHFKIEKANETLVANNWEKVTDILVKELNISSKELEVASKSKTLTNELFVKKLEKICVDDKAYEGLITKLATAMAELDEKIDAPNQNSSGRMMNKIEAGITQNCTQSGETLGSLRMSEMKKKMVSSKSSKMNANVGSIMNAKLARLHSRVEGVHSSYMRLFEVFDFFSRAGKYEQELAANPSASIKDLGRKYGFSDNAEMNKELIARGKKLLLEAHTDKFYNKMGSLNNPGFFKTQMWAMFRPNFSSEWNKEWNSATENTVRILDEVKVNGETPRRIFDGAGRKSLGLKFKEHMNHMYESLGSIERKILDSGFEKLKVGGVSPSDARASKRFDLLGKAPTELLHDTLKQKYNTNKWMKIFAPILGVTFIGTVAAQFLFGKKDPDIKA